MSFSAFKWMSFALSEALRTLLVDIIPAYGRPLLLHKKSKSYEITRFSVKILERESMSAFWHQEITTRDAGYLLRLHQQALLEFRRCPCLGHHRLLHFRPRPLQRLLFCYHEQAVATVIGRPVWLFVTSVFCSVLRAPFWFWL